MSAQDYSSKKDEQQNEKKFDSSGPIFISYRRSDGHPIAELLDTYLRSAGLVPWRDLVDLPPGETATRVKEAFAEGISAAILVVTEELEESKFVPQHEVPALIELEKEQDDFRLLILNAIEDGKDSDNLDVEAPARLLQESPSGKDGQFSELRDMKQFAFFSSRCELRQLVADLLRARMKHLAEKRANSNKPVTIQTQTRPEPFADSASSGSGSAGPKHDLVIRLRQDRRTGIPQALGYRCLQQTLPLLVDALHAKGISRVEVRDGGHFSLGWALGAALPITRMKEKGSFTVCDAHGELWGAAKTEGKEKREAASASDEIVCDVKRSQPNLVFASDEDGPEKIVVWLRNGENGNPGPFAELCQELAAGPRRKNDAVELRVLCTENGKQRWIPADRGEELAKKLADELRKLSDSGAELHIVSNLPVALTTLLARRMNTTNCVLYELGGDPVNNTQHYYPVIRVRCGIADGPIAEVFPELPQQRDVSPKSFTNLTPHDVNLYSDAGELLHSWPRPVAEDGWLRVKEKISSDGDGREGEIPVPIKQIRQLPLKNLPPQLPDHGYIVSRVSAAAANRRDFYFPHGEKRDAEGRIMGVSALARFAPDEDERHWLQNLCSGCEERIRAERAKNEPEAKQ